MRTRLVLAVSALALAVLAPVVVAATGSPTVALDGGALYPAPALAATGASGTTGASAAAVGSTATTGPTGASGPAALSATLTQSVAGSQAQILPDGYAAAPADAPPAVAQVIWAANQLIGLPYLYGGGHASFIAPGYDCSGTVSYALHAGALLDSPLDSSAFANWGLSGTGTWITVYTNPQHAFLEIAGIRLDTSTQGDPGGQSGPRWRPLLPSPAGYSARYPAGY
jgi:cell wall-associated NlpC family hydrolase